MYCSDCTHNACTHVHTVHCTFLKAVNITDNIVSKRGNCFNNTHDSCHLEYDPLISRSNAFTISSSIYRESK